MRHGFVLFAAITGLSGVLIMGTPSAFAQQGFTFTDDASTTSFVSLIATPNSAHTAYTGFYQQTAAYLGKDTTTFQVYGYSATSPVAYAQYDAEKAAIGGAGAKFTRVTLNAVIAPAHHTPTQAVTLSASADGITYTPLPMKVSGPAPDGGYNSVYTFAASGFKPARFVRFGVMQDPAAKDKAGKFYTTAGIGSVALRGIRKLP